MHLLNVVLFFLKQIEKIKMAPRLFQKSFSIMKMVNARHMSSKSKIYELRTYSIKPECMKPFLELTFEKFHLRTEVSKLHGYWTAELGGLNQVVHIWEYGKNSDCIDSYNIWNCIWLTFLKGFKASSYVEFILKKVKKWTEQNLFFSFLDNGILFRLSGA